MVLPPCNPHQRPALWTPQGHLAQVFGLLELHPVQRTSNDEPHFLHFSTKKTKQTNKLTILNILNGQMLSQKFHAKFVEKIHTKISHWSLLLFLKGGHKNISSWMGGHKNFFWLMGGCKNIAGVFLDIYDPPIPKKMVALSVLSISQMNCISVELMLLSD